MQDLSERPEMTGQQRVRGARELAPSRAPSQFATVRGGRASRLSRGRRAAGVGLWVLAFGLMAAAAIYQRTTGPSYPHRGSFRVDGDDLAYALPRSERTTRDAVVALPDPGPAVRGTLFWRRYPLDEPYTAVPLVRDPPSGQAERKLVASMPRQPAAGKLEYHVVLATPEGRIRIPGRGEDDIVIRYRDPVPAGILVTHVVLVFLAMLVGVRAGLSALAQPATLGRYAWVALGLMTVGGMILGPVVQKYAFGQFWTGFPRGGDLTDNKMLVMWLAWIGAAAVVAFRPGPRDRFGRAAAIAAVAVMMAVYLVPHSMRGSELDYAKLDAGVPARDAETADFCLAE